MHKIRWWGWCSQGGKLLWRSLGGRQTPLNSTVKGIRKGCLQSLKWSLGGHGDGVNKARSWLLCQAVLASGPPPFLTLFSLISQLLLLLVHKLGLFPLGSPQQAPLAPSRTLLTAGLLSNPVKMPHHEDADRTACVCAEREYG